MSSQFVQARHQEVERVFQRAAVSVLGAEHGDFPIPCIVSPQLSAAFAIDVFICDVTQGPTCSWKDCVATSAVEEALQSGQRKIVVASSGNHGRAIAYTCRARGLEAAVLVYQRTPPDVVDSLLVLGAKVYRYPDRAAVHEALRSFRFGGWYAATLLDDTRAGALMPGAIGYQRIARSIAEAVADDPIVVVPTCYGDGATAIQQHLVELGRRPTMCLVRAAAGDSAIAASIATDVLTPQVIALEASGAVDVRVGDDEIRAGVLTMSTAAGKTLDLAEGGTPEALCRLVGLGAVGKGQPVICVLTGALYPGLIYDCEPLCENPRTLMSSTRRM